MFRIFNIIRRFSHTLETQIEANTYRRLTEFNLVKEKQIKQPKQWEGFLNEKGVHQFRQKHTSAHFKALNNQPNLRVSSIGVGTYKGSLNQEDDLLMYNGIIDSVLQGCNLIDSCRNFRKGRSQQIINLALNHLFQHQGYDRNNFFIGSKAGYVFQDLPQGVNSSDVLNQHCVHPLFLQNQLEKSLKNMGLNTLDCYYLNNFAQSQMLRLDKQQFDQRLAKAFETLEKARSNNKIRYYGLSSWEAFRLQEGKPGHLSLERVMRIAEKVGGKSHGMRFIQLPINIMMPEVFADKYKNQRSFLDNVEEYGLNVISNSPILSGTLINIPMPASLLKCNNNGAKHLQLVRSIPSKALVCTLVGHKRNRHVKKNLQVMRVPPLDEGEWLNVFVPKASPNPIET